MKDKPIIIGIDGGASKVSARVIEISDDNKFSLGKHNSVKEYANYPEFQKDFKPLELKIQLSQISNNNIILTKGEESQTIAYYAAFIDAIDEIVQSNESKELLLGIGMPGIKSEDKRGIIAMANGPRLPLFASEIEQRLNKKNISLAMPIQKLGSDADYCGMGEEFAENGAFRELDNVYYIGGGTGAADALKLNGKLISFDECKSWLAKTWELKDVSGKSIETFCSARGIQSIYGSIKGISQTELVNNKIFLEQILDLAIGGEAEALTTWEIVTKNIAELIFERISTIYSGWQNNFEFINLNREELDSNHKFRGTLFDRIVIGQRLGNVFKNKSAHSIIVEPLLNHLSELIENSVSLNDSAKSYYLTNGQFKNNIIVTSQLREAPALGAGIDAWNNYANN